MAGRRRNVNIGANSMVYSGRGRPRTKEVVEERPLPVGIVLGSTQSPSSPSAMSSSDLYKNRKIRVGGPFQAKVPKHDPTSSSSSTTNKYASARPAPSRVSLVHPHLTQQEVENYHEHRMVEQGKQHTTDDVANEVTEAMDVDTAVISQTATTTASPNNNNNNHSSNSLDSNISGSLKTATTDRQQQADDDMNDGEEDEDDTEESYKTKRGGLLILCPAEPASVSATSTTTTTSTRSSTSPITTTTRSSAEDDFWSFVEPLMLPTERTCSTTSGDSHSLTTKTWQSQILQWNLDKQQRQHQSEQRSEEELAQQPKKRGRRKRKKEVASGAADQPPLEEENVIEWYMTNVMGQLQNEGESRQYDQHQQQSKRLCVQMEINQGTEEERAQTMQHLWLRHKGQSAAAKLETIVQLSAGKAEMTRRIRKHKRRKQHKPDPNHRYSWRQLCEESNVTAMTGDFRDPARDVNFKYPFPASVDDNSTNDNNFDGYDEPTDVEVQKEIWKSILVFGREIEENLSKASTSTNDVPLPRLSMLLSFLNNAHYVRPIPEDIFRAPSVPPEINTCLNNIMEFVDKARTKQAELIDLLYETYHGGVDLDALQKLLDQTGRALSVELDDAEELYRQVGLSVDWQKRLDAVVGESELSLSSLEDLAEEGRNFAFRTKSLVQLESRIHKAYLLRDRIDEWRKSCIQDEEDLEDKKESVKFLGAMVRDAKRLNLIFPEVSELLETHRSVEAWIDRASIAIRSRISLTEIKTLLETGEDMHVDLADFMEKLRARVSLAEEWIDQFKEVVPCPEPLPTANSVHSDNTLLLWMIRMRDSLVEGKHSALHDFASEGSRIPVDVDIVKLLQVELDAKIWTMKARKWIPSLAKEESVTCKRGKLEDLREHLEKSSVLREKLALPAPVRIAWVLEGEKEMRAIVQAADDWFEKYKPYLDWDNRRSEGRSCLSLDILRTIVEEASSIHANIGSATGKMSRILTQAEGWVKEYQTLLVRCKIVKNDEDDLPQPLFVTLPQMAAAAEAAASDVSLDLDEAKELESLVHSVKDWSNRVLNAAPKRSKRQGRGRKAKVTVDDIIELIKEASNLPVDTSEDVKRLQIQLSEVQEWRHKALQELEEIFNGFQKLRFVVDDMYGPPSEYARNQDDKAEASDDDDDNGDAKNGNEGSEEKKIAEDMSVCETSSTAGSEQDIEGMSQLGNGKCNVNQLIKNYRKEAKSFGVISGEVEAADQLERISNWCVRSLKYLITQRDIFDKRFFGAFDRFIGEGKELVAPPKGADTDAHISLDDTVFAEKLNSTWGAFVSDQLRRLEILLVDRERFMSWSNSAEGVLFSVEKRPSLEVLKDIADKSRDFPSVCDMVQKVRGLYNKTMEWKESTGKLLEVDAEKLNMYEAKTVLDEGEKLGFLCDELKVLRNAHRAARNWANRVKKCKVEQGSTNANDVQDLIEEHDDLLLELPEELEKLQQAMKSYCICRRPYSGFMIGCDKCEEWYHGSCIGVSESKADRFDKFVCVRCCVTRAFKSTAKEAVGVVRKWTCQKDMKKARQVEAQKHQRKVRKETKDVEKLRSEIKSLEESHLQAAPESGLAEDPSKAPDVIMEDAENSVPVESSMVAESTAPADTQDSSKPDEAGEGAQSADAQESSKPDEPQEGAQEGAQDGSQDGAQEGAQESTSTQERPQEEEKKKPAPPTLSPEQAKAKINKALAKIEQCTERLSILTKQAGERKHILLQEDAKAPQLRNWCLRVRSLVLIPRNDEAAEESRPFEDGSLSFAMRGAIEEARELDLSHLADVEGMLNSFRCMSWCVLATSFLARKASLDEVELLVSQAGNITFPEEKALRMIKGIHGRAKSWQTKVMKELTPVSGEAKCFNLDALKDLETAAEDIPMRLKEETLLAGVIEDKGARHCVCGGPSDARFMLSCDNCEHWFHGPCVKITKEQCDETEKWMCPPCSGSPLEVDRSCGIVLEELKTRSKTNVSPEAPDPAKMWPPFGLFGAESALEVLGEKCSSIPDVGAVGIEAQSSPSGEIQSEERPEYAEPEPKSEAVAANMKPEAETTSIPRAENGPDIAESSAAEVWTVTVPVVTDAGGDTDAQAQPMEACKLESEPPQLSAYELSSDLSGLNAVVLAAAGQQVPMDPTQAQFHFTAAASMGNQPAAMNVEDQAAMNPVAEVAKEAQSDEKPASTVPPAAELACDSQVVEEAEHREIVAVGTKADGESTAWDEKPDNNTRPPSPPMVPPETEMACDSPVAAASDAKFDEGDNNVPEEADNGTSSSRPPSPRMVPPATEMDWDLQVTEMEHSEHVASDSQADNGETVAADTKPENCETVASDTKPDSDETVSSDTKPDNGDNVASKPDNGDNTAPADNCTSSRPPSPPRVPQATGIACDSQVSEIEHSETGAKAEDVPSRRPPSPPPSVAPTSESTDQSSYGVGVAPEATPAEIEMSSAQMNPAAMSVMVPALPVHDSGS